MKAAKDQHLSRNEHRCYDCLSGYREDAAPMTNEERDRAMDFVIESLAGLTANGQEQDARLKRLIEPHEKAERRLDRSEYRLDRYERHLRCDRTKKMTNEESSEKRRKLDRDMDRLERVLKKMIEAPRKTQWQLREDARRKEFNLSCDRICDEIKVIAARSDAKIKALAEEMQRRNARRS